MIRPANIIGRWSQGLESRPWLKTPTTSRRQFVAIAAVRPTERLNAKPGITGLWQVYGRGNTDFSDWVKWDTLYYEKISLSLDIRILLLTAKQVLARRGAR